jgi:crotonobetainyl-CoA:carnitine CoA-transferase CaiB-like acyl-CoA transferase
VAVYAFVSDHVAERTTQEWLDLLAGADIPHTAAVTMDDLFADEHLRAVGFFPELDHPSEGRLRTTKIPGRWTDSQPELRRPAPRLGQDSGAVLAELGYSDAEIRALAAAGATRLEEAAWTSP